LIGAEESSSLWRSRGARDLPPRSATSLEIQRLFKNIGTTWILNFLQIVALMVLAPFVIRHLGTEQNGLWVVIVGYTDYLRLLILGIPMASVRYTAEHVARKDTESANRAIATCMRICVMLGVGAWIVGGICYFVFDANLHSAHAGDLSPATIDGARIAFAMVMLQVGMGFAMRLPYGLFDAHNDFVLRNLVMAGELVLRLVLTLSLLTWRPDLPSLALVQIICMLAEFAALVLLIRRRYPGIRLGVRDYDASLVKSILSFSLFAMVLNVGTLLAFRSDAIVISAFLPLSEATYFDAGNKFFEPMTQLLIAVGAVVMPMATRLKATGDVDELRHVFLKWSKICLSIVLLIGLYLLVLGPDFLGMWIDPSFVEPSGRVLQVLMLSFLFYLPVRGVALPILLGLGSPAAPAVALLAMGVVNVLMSIALVRTQGIFGVALGTAVPNVLFAAVILVMACRALGVRVNRYLAYVAAKCAVGALVPLAFLAWCKYGWKVEGRFELLASGAVMVVVFAITWIVFVFRNDPYLDVGAALARLRKR
jgi:O-antigen/teichoic acid export membrane protein